MKNIFLFLYVLFLTSCVKDKPEPAPSCDFEGAASGGVFIMNEGNYQWGNASISYYNPAKNEIAEDVFKAANNYALGDVCQSMEIFNRKAYVVVNNSGKVEVVDPKTFKVSATIKGLTSPRYFFGVSNNKAYVTDFSSNAISVVDLNSYAIIKDIPCPGWTEELVLSYGKAFITNVRKEYIYVVNTTTDAIEDSIKVGFAPNSIKIDKYGMIWVLCGGSTSKNIKASLHKINPLTHEVNLSWEFFNQEDSPGRLDINGTKDTLYFLNKGVYLLPVTNNSLPAAPLIREEGKLFYGLGIDPLNGTIYVSDAVDYVQKGKVYRYKPDGILINSFLAGIIPGDFYFE